MKFEENRFFRQMFPDSEFSTQHQACLGFPKNNWSLGRANRRLFLASANYFKEAQLDRVKRPIDSLLTFHPLLVFLAFNQGDEVGGSNERFPLTSNFDAKNIHEVKQSSLLIAIF